MSLLPILSAPCSALCINYAADCSHAPAACAAPALRNAAAADVLPSPAPLPLCAADTQLANTGLERGAALEKDIAYMQQQWGLQVPVAAEDGIGHRYAKWVLRQRDWECFGWPSTMGAAL